MKETRIGKSNYFISIPPDYSITESNGIDFSVYYFLPKKSEIKNKARGGIYFGNSPSLFEKKNDSCKTEILKGEILGEISDWTVYNCNEDYSIQTIANTKSHAGWDQKVHVFGHVKNKAGIDTILEIYSTLKKK